MLVFVGVPHSCAPALKASRRVLGEQRMPPARAAFNTASSEGGRRYCRLLPVGNACPSTARPALKMLASP